MFQTTHEKLCSHKPRQGGFALLEIGLAVVIGAVLVGAAGITVNRAVQISSAALRSTESSLHTRRALDQVESILASAGSSTLESSGYEEAYTDVYPARGALDRDLDWVTPGVFAWALPLDDTGTGCIFYRVPVTVPDSEQAAYEPDKGAFALYLRPMQTGDRRYEMVHFDGASKRILCKDLENATFRYADGVVTVSLSLILNEYADGSLATLECKRLVIVRLK